MKVELEVSEENEGTDSPWWILVDPKYIKDTMDGIAAHGEVPSEERILSMIAFSVEGPFFSRKEGEDYLKSRSYGYSSHAGVWCASGHRSKQYREAWRKK